MKKTIVFLLLALLGTAWGQAPQKSIESDASITPFWEEFRAAVIKGDKVAVASLSRFPIDMPYGMAKVRNNTQLVRRYREVFNGETNAAKCFRDGRVEIDPENSKRFTVACKNAAGDEVVIYSFTSTRNGWRFTGLDNINE
jgi:hypothetical protein